MAKIKAGDAVKWNKETEPQYDSICQTLSGRWLVTAILDDGYAQIDNGGRTEIVKLNQLSQLHELKPSFKYYPSYTRFWDAMKDVYEGMSDEGYKYVQDEKKSMISNLKRDPSWYGSPPPRNYDDAIARETFQNWDAYERVKERVDAIKRELMKQTFAELATPKLMYNELEVGTFDFAKASTVLLPYFKYYSLKTKKVVPFEDVEIVKKGSDTFEYKMKKGGSEVVVIPVFEGVDSKVVHKIATEVSKGKSVFEAMKEEDVMASKFYSTVKKSYLWRQDVPKPKNAVRLFILIGGNADVSGDGLLYTGMAAIACAEILEIMGYSVNIIGGFGVARGGLKNPKTGAQDLDSSRFVLFNLKKFTDPINIETILYTSADPSFFRVKGFRVFHLLSEMYGDTFLSGLGSMASNNSFMEAVFRFFLPRDTQKGILYYFFGNITSEIGVARSLVDLVKCVEQANFVARNNAGLTDNPDIQQAMQQRMAELERLKVTSEGRIVKE